MFYIDDKAETVDHRFLHRVRERNGAVKSLVSDVQKIEEIVLILIEKLFRRFALRQAKSVTFHDEIGHFFDFRNLFLVRKINFRFHPVDFLFVTASLYERAVILGVILLFERGKLVEPLDEKSLPFQIGKTERTADRVHTLFKREIFDRFKQSLCRLFVVFAIEPREPYAFFVVFCVRRFLKYRRDTTYRNLVSLREKISGFAGVVIYVIVIENLFFVRIKRRNEIRIVFILFKREIEKFFSVLPAFDFFNLYHI